MATRPETGESGNRDTFVIVDAHTCSGDGTCVQHANTCVGDGGRAARNTCVGPRTCLHDVQTQGDNVAFSATFVQYGDTFCR